MSRKILLMILVLIVIMVAISISVFAYGYSVTYHTSDEYHNNVYDVDPIYMRNRYDYGTNYIPLDDCSVTAWSETSSGKYAYAYVFLRDQDGEVYTESSGNSQGQRVDAFAVGDDDYAQYGQIISRTYLGSTSGSSIENYLIMYVDDENN